MTTNTGEINSKDFADQAVNALSNLKRAMPKDWKKAIQPYQEQIKNQASEASVSTTTAVLMLVKKINASAISMNIVKIQHFFLLAAYCDML